MDGVQRPLELILARNLLSSLSTAALLTDEAGMIAFYNEAAGELLGRRFEETGPMTAQEWGRQHGPFDDEGEPITFGDLDLTQGLCADAPGTRASTSARYDGADTHDRGERDADRRRRRPARRDGLLLGEPT